ncbi:hypothetical protein GWI33_014230 [Rhynchophorus ferrugineus]|uniref:Uncharacterized protein n=1 Tax=Rhynchophorus ferrugineus TaxID=354439 RepID=A0A834I7M6_RHYFE|nr:hypothetical protein GWI33_014230 [Rhynchophorus ferrugineus]
MKRRSVAAFERMGGRRYVVVIGGYGGVMRESNAVLYPEPAACQLAGWGRERIIKLCHHDFSGPRNFNRKRSNTLFSLCSVFFQCTLHCLATSNCSCILGELHQKLKYFLRMDSLDIIR